MKMRLNGLALDFLMFGSVLRVALMIMLIWLVKFVWVMFVLVIWVFLGLNLSVIS